MSTDKQSEAIENAQADTTLAAFHAAAKRLLEEHPDLSAVAVVGLWDSPEKASQYPGVVNTRQGETMTLTVVAGLLDQLHAVSGFLMRQVAIPLCKQVGAIAAQLTGIQTKPG